jgi:hypothetical protein
MHILRQSALRGTPRQRGKVGLTVEIARRQDAQVLFTPQNTYLNWSLIDACERWLIQDLGRRSIGYNPAKSTSRGK